MTLYFFNLNYACIKKMNFIGLSYTQRLILIITFIYFLLLIFFFEKIYQNNNNIDVNNKKFDIIINFDQTQIIEIFGKQTYGQSEIYSQKKKLFYRSLRDKLIFLQSNMKKSVMNFNKKDFQNEEKVFDLELTLYLTSQINFTRQNLQAFIDEHIFNVFEKDFFISNKKIIYITKFNETLLNTKPLSRHHFKLFFLTIFFILLVTIIFKNFYLKK